MTSLPWGLMGGPNMPKKKKEKKKGPNFKKLKKISTGIMALCLVQFGHILVIEKMYLILKNLQQGKIT